MSIGAKKVCPTPSQGGEEHYVADPPLNLHIKYIYTSSYSSRDLKKNALKYPKLFSLLPPPLAHFQFLASSNLPN